MKRHPQIDPTICGLSIKIKFSKSLDILFLIPDILDKFFINLNVNRRKV